MDDASGPSEFEAVTALLFNAAPERKCELEGLLARYKPRFTIVGEISNGDHGQWVMEAGNYIHVHFNQRALRTFWLGCYVIWDCYAELAHAIDEGRSFDATEPATKLRYLRELLESEDSLTTSWPSTVPEPRNFQRDQATPEVLAPGELAMAAVAWALLHEFRHLQAQQDCWSSTHGTREDKHAEEFECDQYAAEFLMSSLASYCTTSGESEESVRLKRLLGILFGVLVLGLITPDLTQTTDTHPSVCDRLVRLMKTMQCHFSEKAGTILFCAVSVLDAVEKKC